ncbi:uncharacterized protein MYCFIDRAFT_87519 [Pseudocercospora fijiensis CIRAD86]|uniref:Uncharacterized protein n=1 Tax=Pseudocercospora fijiensis (strain CIRAD86) TaxID=383855 RepID=N1Q7G9_PSEFD|nr:uncharacterized protein MYCFIDRAFT_87519 [Pseudocercospora fijiensis CIRAD86]EME88614.1 hypothetical protein MYCFIDRAFT_87519 [Pseudocercospora fijiensis CIRAD86]
MMISDISPRLPFLQRSTSNRLKKNATVKGRMQHHRSGLTTSTTSGVAKRDIFDNIDEAVQEHRKSMAGRPKSAGVDKRKRSASRKRADIVAKDVKEVTQPPKCGEDLQKVGRTIEYTAGLDTFRFPTPSPRMPPPSATLQDGARFPGMAPRSATYQQLSPPLINQESPHIGRAIGSPSNAPPSWGRSYTSDHISNRMPNREPPSRVPPAVPPATELKQESPETRKKKSSWKAFSSMFRKSSKRNTDDSFYKVQMPAQPKTAGIQCHSPEPDRPCTPGTPLSCLRAPSPDPGMFSHSRAPSCHRSQSRLDERNENRTSFMPAVKSKRLRSPVKRDGAKSPNPWRASEDIFSGRDGRHESPTSDHGNEGMAVPRTPRLDLDLPAPEFPRYSVMFEKLLNGDSKPSLLERRQSKIHRTKSQKRRNGEPDADGGLQVNTNGSGVKRALTSPHLTRSLSIRVDGKKITEEPETAIHRPRLIQRSKTAPPGAVSPIAAAFMRQKEAQVDSSPDSSRQSMFSEPSLPPTPTTFTTCTDTSSIRRVIEDSGPSCDMMTSKTTAATSDDLSSHRSARTEPYPRVKSPEDLERQIVQVSVARQVSVSRARTRVQRAASSKAAAQPLRPRVVELTKNRKSTVGVVEDASAEPMPDDAASIIAHSRATSMASQMSFEKSRKTSVASAAPMPEDAVKVVAHSRAASGASQILLEKTRKADTSAAPMPGDASKVAERESKAFEAVKAEPPVDLKPGSETETAAKEVHTPGEDELDAGSIA